MNLYEIATEYRIAFDQLSEMDGVTHEIIADTLSHVQDEFNDKAIALTSYFKNLEAEASAIKEAEKNMYERRKSIEKRIDGMREYLKNQMISAKINKISCPYFSVTLSRSKSSVKIIDESMIPKYFIREKTIREPMKDEILKAGGCEGAEIIEGYSLKIK